MSIEGKIVKVSMLNYFFQTLKDMIVFAETGKGLSTNDYTNTDKEEVAKIAGIIAKNGEPNKIEAVQMGYKREPETITDKKVIIPSVYTDIGDGTYSLIDENGNTFYHFDSTPSQGISVGLGTGQSGGGVRKLLVDKDYVDNNAGKIDKIKINGDDVYIDAQKSVDISFALTSFEWSSNSFNQVGSYMMLTGPEQNAASPTLRFTKTANGVQIYGEHDTGMQAGLGGVEVTDKSYVDSTIDSKIADALAGITEIDFIIVATNEELPATGVKGKFYLKATGAAAGNKYEEYVWVNHGTAESPDYGYEKLGTMDVDLTGYVKESDLQFATQADIDAIFTTGA